MRLSNLDKLVHSWKGRENLKNTQYVCFCTFASISEQGSITPETMVEDAEREVGSCHVTAKWFIKLIINLKSKQKWPETKQIFIASLIFQLDHIWQTICFHGWGIQLVFYILGLTQMFRARDSKLVSYSHQVDLDQTRLS